MAALQQGRLGWQAGGMRRSVRPRVSCRAAQAGSNRSPARHRTGTRCCFMPDDNLPIDCAPTAGTATGSQPAPVEPEQHWSTLLTTMPGLNSRTWAGRLGQYVLHAGPSASPDALTEQGSVLHLWRSASEPPEAGSAQPSDSGLPDAVAVTYFTAPGASVAQQGGGAYTWDQQHLAARPTGFVFSPSSPQMSLTLAGAANGRWQSPPLHRSLRLLPLSSSGVAVVHAGLPQEFGPAAAAAVSPGSQWFFELLLTHPDASGEWQASTLGVAYDLETGKLHSHKFLWQKATAAVGAAPPDDLSAVTVAAVSAPVRNGSASLSQVAVQLSELSELGSPLQHHSTCYSYASSPDGQQQQQLMRCDHHQVDSLPAAGRPGSAAGGSSSVALQLAAVTADLELSSEAGADAAEAPDGGRVTLWFPQGGVYARVPAQLPGAVPAGGGEVVFEMGAFHGDAAGLSRCLLTYPTDGDRRIKQVLNDSWTLAEPAAAAAAALMRDRTATRTAPGLV